MGENVQKRGNIKENFMAECYTVMTIGEGREGYGRVLYSHDNRGGEGGVWQSAIQP